jgi:hypothetical protein
MSARRHNAWQRAEHLARGATHRMMGRLSVAKKSLCGLPTAAAVVLLLLVLLLVPAGAACVARLARRSWRATTTTRRASSVSSPPSVLPAGHWRLHGSAHRCGGAPTLVLAAWCRSCSCDGRPLVATRATRAAAHVRVLTAADMPLLLMFMMWAASRGADCYVVRLLTTSKVLLDGHAGGEAATPRRP